MRRKTSLRVNAFLEKIWLELEGLTQNEQDIYEKVKQAFSAEADALDEQTEAAAQTLQNVFDFMEAAFGDSQEMVAFITELNANFTVSGSSGKTVLISIIVIIRDCYLTTDRS